jgi:O-antigen ligase
VPVARAFDWGLLALVVAATFFVSVPWGDETFDRFHLTKELALALGAGVVVWRFRSLDPIDLALLGWCGVVVLSAALSENRWLGLRQGTIAVAAACLFIASRGLDAAGRERLQQVVLKATFVVAVLAVLEAHQWVQLCRPGYAPGATIGQRNTLAHLLALAAPWAWQRARSARARSELIGWSLVVAVFAAAVMLTRCRAAYLGLPVGLAVTTLAGRWSRGLLVAVALTVLALVTVGLTRPGLAWNSAHPYRDSVERLFDAEHGSGRGRWVEARASMGLIAAHPALGVGPGNWAVDYPLVTPPADPSFFPDRWEPVGRLINSDWVAAAVEQGLFGLAALGVFAVLLLRALLRLRGPAAAFGCLAALSVVGMFDAVLQLAPAAAFCACTLGASLPRDEHAGRSIPRAVTALIAALLFASSLKLGLQLEALRRLAHPEWGLESLHRAGDLDPASLSVHGALVELCESRRDCECLREEAAVLLPLYPHNPRVIAVAHACPR